MIANPPALVMPSMYHAGIMAISVSQTPVFPCWR